MCRIHTIKLDDNNKKQVAEVKCTLRILRLETLSFLKRNVIVVNKIHKKNCFKKTTALSNKGIKNGQNADGVAAN